MVMSSRLSLSSKTEKWGRLVAQIPKDEEEEKEGEEEEEEVLDNVQFE